MNDLEFIRRRKELEDAISVSVKISADEKDKIVIRDLISKRETGIQHGRDVTAIEQVLKKTYLGEVDYQKYVIRQEEID